MKNSQETTIEEKIGLTFNNKNLLHQALVHRSFLNENPKEVETNERLEFLGDAILEFLVSEHIYTHFTKQDEGQLTQMRSRLVNTQALAAVAKTLNLGDALYLSYGEEKGGGRQNSSLLANTVEALIGAIFLDLGINGARKFVQTHVLTRLEEVVKKSLKDAKSLLQEFVQAQSLPAPIYKTIEALGPDHAKKFKIQVMLSGKPYAQGEGASKQLAAQAAAENALTKWKTQPKP